MVLRDEAAGTVTLLALNKSLTEPMEISADLRSFGNLAVAEHQVLTHEDVKAVNTEADPDNVKPAAGTGAALEGGKLTAVLPAKSFTLLSFREA